MYLGHAIVGAAVYAAAQYVLYWAAGDFPSRSDGPGWFLNSGTNVLVMATAVAVVSACASLLAKSTHSMRSAALAVGAIAAMIGTMLITNTIGGLFPIVVAIGGIVIVGAAIGGGLVGGVVGGLLLARGEHR
jgi:hypothetical protein